MRSIAILLVMLGNFRKPFTGVWLLDTVSWAANRTGGRGVDLFFVLSGFLVGGLLLKEYRDTGTMLPWRFLVRRAFKIWPAYYFLIFFHLASDHHPMATFFWQNFFHLQNYLGSSISQTWTLSVEEHFYFGLALLLGYAASRHWRPGKILIMLAALSSAALIARSITLKTAVG